MRKNLFEFLRYVLVGGLAFLVDFGILYVLTNWAFPEANVFVYLSHAISFIAGLLTNFFLSNLFVFTAPAQRTKGRDFKSFVIFAGIGLVGLGLTEFGAWAANALFGSYTHLFTIFSIDVNVLLVTKLIMAVIVLIWNYVARKLIVYDRPTKQPSEEAE